MDITHFIWMILGLLSGLLSGLLGIGGGSILVPGFIFSINEVSLKYLHHIAIATSTACILFTSCISTFSHFRQKFVMQSHMWYLLVGSLLGSYTISYYFFMRISGQVLQMIFVGFLSANALYMLFFEQDMIKQSKKMHDVWYFFCGMAIASISSLIGVGGGFLTVPLLLFLGSDMRTAVATSSLNGIALALGSTFAYLHMPSYSNGTKGLIYIPALVWVCALSTLVAYMSVCWVYRVQKEKLKRIYAYVMLLICVLMLCRQYLY